MHHTGERLNQLTELGFQTETGCFTLETEKGKFIIEMLDVQCYSKEEWDTLMNDVKAVS